MKNELTFRIARESDAENLIKIYSPYIEKTAVTFEYTPPSAEEFRGRITKTLSKFPYIVAEFRGEPVAYAYASTYIPRKACDHSCEVSIYISEKFRGRGIGKRLYSSLEGVLRLQNITNVYASVAYAENEDEYLTHSSIVFHKHMGYRPIGKFSKCGYKFGKWYDLVWFEKFLVAHENPGEFLPFPAIEASIQF